MNRTVIRSDIASRAAQGRSVGFQLAWLRAAQERPDLFPDQESHHKLKLRDARCSPCLAYDVRRGLRAEASSMPALAPIFDEVSPFEGRRRAGECPEPADLSY